jgi:hypothetical protein
MSSYPAGLSVKRSTIRNNPVKTPPQPKEWQQTEKVSMKDFTLRDIKMEFSCDDHGWAGLDVDVRTTYLSF